MSATVTYRAVPVAPAASSVAKTGQASYTVTLPSDVAAGEVGILTFHILGGQVPVDPAGWTLLQNNAQGTVIEQYQWWKLMTAADSGTDVTVTTPSGVRGTLTCVLVANTTGTPSVGAPAIVSNTSITTNVAGAGATTTAANSMVLETLSLRSTANGATVSCGSDGGFTELYDYCTSATATPTIDAAAYAVPVASAGAMTAPMFTPATSVTYYIISSVVFAPAPDPVKPTVFKRKPGSIELGIYTGPTTPPIRLKTIGLTDGKVIYPAHLSVLGTVEPPNPDEPYVFKSSGAGGGGFQNDAKQCPFTIPSGPNVGARPIIVAADVAGLHRTLDGGKFYEPRNLAKNKAGNFVGLPTHVSDTYWSKIPAKAGTAYALTDSGIYRSTDFGGTFQERGIGDGAANGKVDMLEIDGREHPRHTSGLIAQSDDGACLWVACKNGVVLSKDEGLTQTGPKAFADDHVRAIAWDKNNNRLIVAIHNGGFTTKDTHVQTGGDPARNGVWQITDATSGMSATSRLGTGWPFDRGCEALWLDDAPATTTVYAACHNAGVASWTSGAWVVQNNGLDDGQNLSFQALDGVRVSGQVKLIVGGSGFGAGSSPARNQRYIYYGTVNNTTKVVTWTCATAPNRSASNPTGVLVNENDYGSTEPSFIANFGYQDFGNSNDWVSSSLFFDADNPNRVYTAGRGGLWIGDRDATNGSWTWQASTKGLMVTVNMFAIADPVAGSNVAIGSMDYTLLYSTDNGTHVKASSIQKDAGAPSTGDAGSFDGLPITGKPTALLIGASERGAPQQNNANAMYYSTDPFGSNPNWQKLGFANASPAMPAGGTYDVVGVCLGRDAPGGTPVFMALVNQVGVYRQVGVGGTPKKVTDLPLPPGDRPVAYWVWVPNSTTVYCHIAGGVYRSDDAGESWVKIYVATTTTYGRYNTLALAPTNANKLYVSNGPNGVVRIDNGLTTTGTGTTNTTTLTTTGVGSIAVHKPTGRLYADVPGSGGLLMWKTPLVGSPPAYEDIADSMKKGNGRSIRSICVTNDGYLLTADNGQGTMMGKVID